MLRVCVCVCGIDFASFYDFPIGSWNGFEYVIIIVFHFIISTRKRLYQIDGSSSYILI
jgi:hypothetical protein